MVNDCKGAKVKINKMEKGIGWQVGIEPRLKFNQKNYQFALVGVGQK